MQIFANICLDRRWENADCLDRQCALCHFPILMNLSMRGLCPSETKEGYGSLALPSGICYLEDKPYCPNLSDSAECVKLCTSWLQYPGKVSQICDLRICIFQQKMCFQLQNPLRPSFSGAWRKLIHVKSCRAVPLN